MVAFEQGDGELWIDAISELSVEVDGHKGWSADAGWNLMDDAYYSHDLIHPLQKCAFGDYEFLCPHRAKAVLCATNGNDLNVQHQWSHSRQSWEIRSKWSTRNNVRSYQNPWSSKLV